MSAGQISKQEIADVLTEALALMNDQGAHWTQGSLYKAGDRYCALGAIKQVTGGHLLPDRQAPRLRAEAVTALAEALGMSRLYDDWTTTMQRITNWNDRPGRDWLDVVQLFQEARDNVLGRPA